MEGGGEGRLGDELIDLEGIEELNDLLPPPNPVRLNAEELGTP